MLIPLAGEPSLYICTYVIAFGRGLCRSFPRGSGIGILDKVGKRRPGLFHYICISTDGELTKKALESAPPSIKSCLVTLPPLGNHCQALHREKPLDLESPLKM